MLWAGIIVAARLVLVDLVYSGAHLRIPFPPLDASLDWRPGWPLVLPVALGVLLVAGARRFAALASWRTLLIGATCVAAAWAVALALLDGGSGLVGSVNLKNEYLPDVGRVGAPLDFLGRFASHISEYRIHVQGHPPGYLLLLSFLDRIGLATAPAVATIEIAVGALAVPAVLVAVREVAGEERARAAWAFVAAAPLAIWVATSADAFYAGVGAWAVTLVVLATGRTDRRGDRYAFAGGLLFGTVAFLSYGLVLLAVIPLAVAWQRRCARPLVVAAGWRVGGVRGVRARGLLVVLGARRNPGAVPRRRGVTATVRRLPARERRLSRHRRRACDRSGTRTPARSEGLVARGRCAPRDRRRRGERHVER